MAPEEKRQRLLETASAALSVAPKRSLNVVVLNKVLFYVDLASLRDRGETVTRNTYVGLQNGPVIARCQQRLVEGLSQAGLAEQRSEWNGAKPVVLREDAPTEFEYVDAMALSTVSDVTNFFADSQSKEASDFSHRNVGWQLAWDYFSREGKPIAVNMRIAMQQIIESDPWMQLPLRGEDELLAAADDAIGDEW